MKVNYTFEFETDKEALNFEYWIKQFDIKIVDLRHFYDTSELKEDKTFKALNKAKRKAGEELDRYINDYKLKNDTSNEKA